MWNEASIPVPRKVLLEGVKGATAIFCMIGDIIDEEILDSAGPQLKIISTMSVGFDHIDIAACTKRNIKVGNTPGVYSFISQLLKY